MKGQELQKQLSIAASIVLICPSSMRLWLPPFPQAQCCCDVYSKCIALTVSFVFCKAVCIGVRSKFANLLFCVCFICANCGVVYCCMMRKIHPHNTEACLCMVYDISITHNIDANTRIEHLLLCLRVAILYHCSSFSDICDCCNNPISLNQRTVLIGGTTCNIANPNVLLCSCVLFQRH